MIMEIFGIILSIICLGATGLNSDLAAEDANQLLASPAIEAMMEQAAPEMAAIEAKAKTEAEAPADATEVAAAEAVAADEVAAEATEAVAAEAAAEPATKPNGQAPYTICYSGDMNEWSDAEMTYNAEKDYYYASVKPSAASNTFKIKQQGDWTINWGRVTNTPMIYDDYNRGWCNGVTDAANIEVPSEDSFDLIVKYIDDANAEIYVNREPLIDLACVLQSSQAAFVPLTYNQNMDYYYSEIKPANESDVFRIVVPGNGVTNWGGHIDYVDGAGKCKAVADGQWINVPSSSMFRLYVKYYSDEDVDIYVNIEPRDPTLRTVYVNLDGGELTDQQLEQVKEDDWFYDNTQEKNPSLFWKDVNYGADYKTSTELWTKITPSHGSHTFGGWNPSLDSDTKITTDTTFYAMWLIGQHKVSVVIGDATMTDAELKKLESVGWKIDKDEETLTYFKNIDDGKTYAEAMAIWASIVPKPKDTTSKFEGWEPKFDETEIDKDTIFKAVYSSPEPETADVTVDLDGGTITKEEAKYLEADGWKIQKDENTPLLKKQVKLGITYKEAMKVWTEKVSPTKTDYDFDGWDPEVDTTEISKDVTFKAQWKSEGPEPPVPTTYLVSVDLSGGLITEEESGALIEDGWDLAPDENNLVFSKEFEKGTTYLEALKVWLTISPTKDEFTFEGWDPTPDSTQLSEAKTFTAVYKAVEPDPPGPGPDPDPDPDPDVPVNPEQGTTAVSYIAKTADSMPYAVIAFALLTALISTAVIASSKH